MQVDRAIAILSLCTKNSFSVSQLADRVSGNRRQVLELVRELEARGFLTRSIATRTTRGRPRHYLGITSLGRYFAERQRDLLSLRLHVNDNDVRKAVGHADMARRLEQSGISPYARFLEVNELARNIARSAPTRPSL